MKMRRTASRAQPSNRRKTPFFSQSTNQNRRTEPRPFFQPKLEIGAPGDRFEQEADTVADQVVAHGAAPQVQRLCSGCAEEAQREREVRRQPLEEEEELLQPKADTELQRQPLEEEEELLQPKAKPGQAGTAGPELERRLRTNRDSGRPLPSPILADMNSAFGFDFAGVRVHTGSPAVQMSSDVKAQAFTHGRDIYFNQGKFAPHSNPGRRLLAHELTHVLQQGFAGLTAGSSLVQRDLAVPPQGSGVERGLSQSDITDAIDFNDDMFSDPYSYKTIRDVIGIPQYPAVSDEDLALGVARWQADHGIAQDGKVGVVTLMFILEELQAEGQTRDATLLRANFQGSTGSGGRRLPDIDASHCGCQDAIREEIAESQEFIAVYQQCGADPTITTGEQVGDCVDQHFANQGVTLTTAGSTSSSGDISVARVAGDCGPLIEQLTRAHEQVHGVHVDELEQQHGTGAAFDQAFEDAQDWVADEVNSRQTDIATARWMLRVLDRLCGGGGTP